MSSNKGKFYKGTIPISDTRWKVLTVKNNKFIEIGEVFVSGKEVSKEMDEHQSIKGYEPIDIAEKLAYKTFPEYKLLAVERIWE